MKWKCFRNEMFCSADCLLLNKHVYMKLKREFLFVSPYILFICPSCCMSLAKMYHKIFHINQEF